MYLNMYKTDVLIPIHGDQQGGGASDITQTSAKHSRNILDTNLAFIMLSNQLLSDLIL